MRYGLLCILMTIAVAGCTVSRQHYIAGASGLHADACPALDSEQELVINLSREMVDEGRFHAALANLERLPAELPEVRLRKARVLRLLADPRAEPLYSSLLNGCFNAEAHHGLGQVAAAREEYAAARNYLDIAARLAPADDAIRNDLGLVLIHLRELPRARFELLTALELNQANPQPVNNLLTLLIYQDQWQEAGELVRRRGLTPSQFQKAEERARSLRLEELPERGRPAETSARDTSWLKVRPLPLAP